MDNNAFEYTYSARRQQEVEEIRKLYLPKEEDKMSELLRLHAIPTRKAQGISLSVGIIGALIMGTGMSLVLTELGDFLGRFSLVLGIVIGLIGMTMVALAYPIFKHILKTEREKVAPEILKISEDLLK